jgi:hypothetical protein
MKERIKIINHKLAFEGDEETVAFYADSQL